MGEINKKSGEIITLAIETSCDETCAAVLLGARRVLSNVVVSQIPLHAQYGGVVPELASRNHSADISGVVAQALSDAKIVLADVDIFGVTAGPGLVGALLVGVSYAKALAYAQKKPLYAVNHIAGHIAANYIGHKTLEPPFAALIVSGGHTSLLLVNSYLSLTPLAQTSDDAAGEAFDKIARVLNLGYPGGPKIDKLAQSGVCEFTFPPAAKEAGSFSYSGLKTAVINFLNTKKQGGESVNIANLCASFSAAAFDALIARAFAECAKCGVNKLAVCGGVAANSYLRKKIVEKKPRGTEVFLPELHLCGDNAAMIACAAHYMHACGAAAADLTLNASPTLPL